MVLHFLNTKWNSYTTVDLVTLLSHPALGPAIAVFFSLYQICKYYFMVKIGLFKFRQVSIFSVSDRL